MSTIKDRDQQQRHRDLDVNFLQTVTTTCAAVVSRNGSSTQDCQQKSNNAHKCAVCKQSAKSGTKASSVIKTPQILQNHSQQGLHNTCWFKSTLNQISLSIMLRKRCTLALADVIFVELWVILVNIVILNPQL